VRLSGSVMLEATATLCAYNLAIQQCQAARVRLRLERAAHANASGSPLTAHPLLPVVGTQRNQSTLQS
jgi:hypothetical protein